MGRSPRRKGARGVYKTELPRADDAGKAQRSLHDLRSRIEFEASSPRTAERAYRRAVEKLTLNLVGLGALHAVRIERTAPGTYRYQADNDGDWGEFTLDAETGDLQIISLAELNATKTHRFAEQAARYLRKHARKKLPKTVLVAFE